MLRSFLNFELGWNNTSHSLPTNQTSSKAQRRQRMRAKPGVHARDTIFPALAWYNTEPSHLVGFSLSSAIMSLNTAIPRFLLPRRGWIWTARLSMPSASSLSIRHASKKTSTKMSSKPFVLEKPNKFNPPSHGARLPKDTPRYPGPQLSAEEQARQKTKKYPNLMPPEGTFMHWFLNNKTIHIYISLVSLAIYRLLCAN
jgi:hypothetical protein